MRIRQLRYVQNAMSAFVAHKLQPTFAMTDVSREIRFLKIRKVYFVNISIDNRVEIIFTFIEYRIAVQFFLIINALENPS